MKINSIKYVYIICFLGLVILQPTLGWSQDAYTQDIKAMNQLWGQNHLFLKMAWKTSSDQQTSQDIMEYWRKGSQYQYGLSSTQTLVVGNDKIELVIDHAQKQVVIHSKSTTNTPWNFVPDSVLKQLGKPVFSQTEGVRTYEFTPEHMGVEQLKYQFETKDGKIIPQQVELTYYKPMYGKLTSIIQYQEINVNPVYPTGTFQYLKAIVSTSKGYQTQGILKHYHIIQTSYAE